MWPSIHLSGTGVTISAYHLFHVVAWFVFYFVGTGLTRSRPDLRRHWLLTAVGLALCDTVGARVAFQIIHGRGSSGFFATPLLFAFLTGAYCIARKVRATPFIDAWAVAFSASHVFEKIACLAAGCCFGRPTQSVFGVAIGAMHGDTTRYLPLPLLEASLHLIMALFLALLYRRGLFQGRLVMLLGVFYGFWRSATDLARGGQKSPFLDGPLSVAQVACVLAMIFSLVYLVTKSGESRHAR